jgi:hypothetical protein
VTLVEWLLVQVAGDERKARLIRWSHADAFNDPQRVLTECAAKRRRIELHAGGHECPRYDGNGEVDPCAYSHEFENCATLRIEALPYADRPGFQPEWAV